MKYVLNKIAGANGISFDFKNIPIKIVINPDIKKNKGIFSGGKINVPRSKK